VRRLPRRGIANDSLRPEKFRWTHFRTRVRLPPAPPHFVRKPGIKPDFRTFFFVFCTFLKNMKQPFITIIMPFVCRILLCLRRLFLAPCRKLRLSLVAFIVRLGQGQQAAGDAFNGVIWYLHATVLLTAEC